MTKIRDLVLADRRLKLHEIAETAGFSKNRVGHILHEILCMRKLQTRWVPRLLTPDNKHNRETTLEQCLTLFQCNPKEFCVVSWNSQGVVYIDYLKKGKMITGLYYAEVLGRITEKTATFGKEKSALSAL